MVTLHDSTRDQELARNQDCEESECLMHDIAHECVSPTAYTDAFGSASRKSGDTSMVHTNQNWNFIVGNGRETILGDRRAGNLSLDSSISIRREDERAGSCSWGCHVIDPEHSSWLLTWDSLVSVALAAVAFLTTYQAAFLRPKFLGVLFCVDRCIDAIFLADSILQLWIAFPDYVYRQGRMVTAQTAIIRNYFTGWFIVDAAGLFPMDVLVTFTQIGQSFFGRLLRLVRLLLLLRFLRILRRWDSQFGLSYAKLTLFKFFAIVTLFCHWVACLWGSLAVHMSDGKTETWFSAIQDSGPFPSEDIAKDATSIYGLSVYWAIITLTSIGYGDIVPQNGAEYIVATICSAVMASIWAYVIGSVCGIVATLDPHEVNFKRTMDDLNWMMTDVSMPSDMAQRFRKYFIEAREMSKQRIESAVIDQMSPQLQGECAMFLHQKWIEKVWYLKHMNKEVVVWAARHLTLMVYAPSEEVLPERTLFIVRHGVCVHGGRILIGGDVWGQDMLLSNNHLREKHQAKALTYLHVLKLHITDLSDIVMTFPEARHDLRSAQVKISFNRGFKMLAKELRHLEEKGLLWRDLPSHVRPQLYHQILHGVYDRQEWLDKRSPAAFTVIKSSPIRDRRFGERHYSHSKSQEVLDGIMMHNSPIAHGSSHYVNHKSSEEVLDQTVPGHGLSETRPTQGIDYLCHGTIHESEEGDRISQVAGQLEVLERSLAILHNKMAAFSEPDDICVPSSPHSFRDFQRGGVPAGEELRRRQHRKDLVDFGSLKGATLSTARSRLMAMPSRRVGAPVGTAMQMASKGAGNITTGFTRASGRGASTARNVGTNISGRLFGHTKSMEMDSRGSRN